MLMAKSTTTSSLTNCILHLEKNLAPSKKLKSRRASDKQ